MSATNTKGQKGPKDEALDDLFGAKEKIKLGDHDYDNDFDMDF